MEKALQFLNTHQIEYQLFEHPAVFSVAEAEIHCKHLPGLHCKNLFLQERKGQQQFLVTMDAYKRLNMKELEKELGCGSLRFATAEELQNTLQLTPGSVSPLGLIHDIHKRVTFILDQAAWDAGSINVHPNVNTASIEIPKASVRRLLDAFGNRYKVLSLS